MRILTLFALSLATTAPALAQDAMMKDGMHPAGKTHMSAADMRRMQTCNAMSHERMMRSASCRRVAKMHPDMMKHDAMMKQDGAMAHDSMMKSGN